MKETPSEFQDLLDFFEEIEQDTPLLASTRSASSETTLEVDANAPRACKAPGSISNSDNEPSPLSTDLAPTPATATSQATRLTSQDTYQAPSHQAELDASPSESDVAAIFADVHQLLDQLLPAQEVPANPPVALAPVLTAGDSNAILEPSSSQPYSQASTLQVSDPVPTLTSPNSHEVWDEEQPSYADFIPAQEPLPSNPNKTSKAKKPTLSSTEKSQQQQARQAYYASLRSLLRHSSELQPMGLSSKDQLTTLLEVLSHAKSPIDDHIDYHHLDSQDWEKIRATYTLNEQEIADLEATSYSGSFDYDGELNSKFQFIMANNELLINHAFAEELSSIPEEQLLLQAQQEHYSSNNQLLAQTTNTTSHSAYLKLSESALSGQITSSEQLEVSELAPLDSDTLSREPQSSSELETQITRLTPNGNRLTIHQVAVTPPSSQERPEDKAQVLWHVDLFGHEVTTAEPQLSSAQASSRESQHLSRVAEQPATSSQAQAKAFPDFNFFAEELFQANNYSSNQVTTQNTQVAGIAELLGENSAPSERATPRAAHPSAPSLATNTPASRSSATRAEVALQDLPPTPQELAQARKQQEQDTLQAASILSSLGFNIQSSTRQAAPELNSQQEQETASAKTASTPSPAPSKPTKKPAPNHSNKLQETEGQEFYNQYSADPNELDLSSEVPVLECDAKMPTSLLGSQSQVVQNLNAQPLENFGLCLRFDIDYRQYIDSFKSPENEAVITRILQRLQVPMPACLLLTGAEGASLERKVTRAIYDHIVQLHQRNDGSYLSRAKTFYLDLERLIHSNKPLSFFTSHPEDYDIVIINNIQLCLNSDLWQARLVEIINYCMNNKRILILTSALSKSELSEKLSGLNIMQDLNSRLQFFINLKFARLTGKYLTNYLHGRCVNQGTPLPSSTISYLANIIQVDRSVDIDMTAFRIFKFGVLRNFDTNKLSKYIIMKNAKAFIGRHLLTNKYVTNQDLAIALFRRLEKLKYFDDRAGAYGEVWQELRQQYLAELDLDDNALVTA